MQYQETLEDAYHCDMMKELWEIMLVLSLPRGPSFFFKRDFFNDKEGRYKSLSR